jgi:hypothetical protein
MVDFQTHLKFLYTQTKSFTFIVFCITFALIFLNSKSNILPLNILVLLGSLILFHYYPGYYTIVSNKAPKLTPLLFIYDFIFHYIPLIYIISYKVYNKTELNYRWCVYIVIGYLVLFHSEIVNIYFNYNQYLR